MDTNTIENPDCISKVTDETEESIQSFRIGLIIGCLTCLVGHVTGAKKLFAIILFVLEYPVQTVMNFSGLARSTVYDIRKKMLQCKTVEDILEMITIKEGRGRHRKLTKAEEEALETDIDNQNFHTLQHIMDHIKEKFGKTVGKSAVKDFLTRHGFKKYKCGSFPAKADLAKQREFYEGTMLKLFEDSKTGKIKLFFMDASHFVIGCDFTSSIYSKTRRFVKTLSGRFRYNVLGAIEYSSKQIFTVTNNDYITATEVVKMFGNIKEAYANMPLYIILDNARYQKCKLVEEEARRLGINLVYLPSYSPNLNLIERLWKYVKGELRRQFYDDFDQFKTRIDEILVDAQNKHKDKIDTLIGAKVQLFDELEYMGGNTYKTVKKEEAA